MDSSDALDVPTSSHFDVLKIHNVAILWQACTLVSINGKGLL